MPSTGRWPRRPGKRPWAGANVFFLSDRYLEKKERQFELTCILLKVGLREGFDVYVRPRELDRIRQSPFQAELEGILGRQTGQIVPENFFHGLAPEIREANLLWLKKGRVRAHFEIKYKPDMPETTLRRGRLIRKMWPESERVVVVPENQVKKLRDTLARKGDFWHMACFHTIFQADGRLCDLFQTFEEQPHPAKADPLKLKILHKQDIVDSSGAVVSFKLKLACPREVLRRIRPGHFLKLGINQKVRQKLSRYRLGSDYRRVSGSPNARPQNLEYFRIPISIHRVSYENFAPSAFRNRSVNFLPRQFWQWLESGDMQYLELLIRIAGNGTETLYKVPPGSTVDALGPLGRSIEIPPELHTALLVSGGVGLASLYPIAYALRERGYAVKLFAGAYDKRTLEDPEGNLLPDFQEMGVECHAADELTDRQLVTELFADWLGRPAPEVRQDGCRVYSCGPWPMLKRVHEITAAHGLPCTVLVDKLMLCGVGACMTCVVAVKRKDGEGVEMVRSCLEGPAFEADEIVWE